MVHARAHRWNVRRVVQDHHHRPADGGRRLRDQHRLFRRPCSRNLSMGVPAKDRLGGWPRCDTDCVERGRERAVSRRTMRMTSDAKTEVIETDLLVLGGGTGGPMAAIKAKEKNPALRVVLMEKANVKRSGAISMGMDGLNNAVVPGFATPEQYVREITAANDGIVNQKTLMAYARSSFGMIEELDRLGVKFEKDETGDYAMRKVHHLGTYVLPMPEGHDIKKVLYRQLKRTRVEITNRLVATRLLTGDDGRIAGAMAFDCPTADFHVIRAKAVVLSCGAAGRLGLPASGYLFGTYENPT